MLLARRIRAPAEELSAIRANSNLSALKMSKWKNPLCLCTFFFFLSQMTEHEFNKHGPSSKQRDCAGKLFPSILCAFFFFISGFKASMKMALLMVVARCAGCVIVDVGVVFFSQRERLQSTRLEQ